MVMERDSCPKDCEFESDTGYLFFTFVFIYLFYSNYIFGFCFESTENKRKRSRRCRIKNDLKDWMGGGKGVTQAQPLLSHSKNFFVPQI